MKIKDIPSLEDFKKLQKEDPVKADKLYRESMEKLNRAATRLSVAAIILGAISILLSLTRWLLMK